MKDKGLLYEERGQLRVGRSFWFSTGCSYPLATIEIYGDKLIIKYPLGKVELKKENIIYIEKVFILDKLISKEKSTNFFDEIYRLYIKWTASLYKKVYTTKISYTGIKINHKNLKVSPFIFFSCFHPDKVMSVLKSTGYKTK